MQKAKHAFGMLENIDAALSAGTIDAYDILFVKDADGKPYVGWVDKDGNKVICEDKTQIVRVTELPTADGDENVVYVFENKGYVWDTTQQKCVPMAEAADVTELTGKVTTLEEQIATKVSADDVDAKINKAVSSIEDYEVFDKPDGTLVDYRGKEIRVMCPADTEWKLRASGEGADANSYYIGFKAYAPFDTVVSFKEDLAQTISDTTMYYFEGNDYAGVDANGRKYSTVWLPVAKYDSTSKTWTYHGANSKDGKYIGWYYSVEWYNASGEIVASDCIRINLSNEDNYSSVNPFYMNNAIETAKTYTDEQIETKIAEMTAVEVVEF